MPEERYRRSVMVLALAGALLALAAGPAAARRNQPDCGVNPANPDCVYRTPWDPNLNAGLGPRSAYQGAPQPYAPAPYPPAPPYYAPSPYAQPPLPAR